MGLAISHDINKQNNTDALNTQSSQELKIIQWRANPQFNQFIPKVFLQYQSIKKKTSILNQCQLNQNLPIGIKYQKFIGNLTILYAKLQFQQSLFVLKCLLSGFNTILDYFGKVIVDANLCFITRQGQIKVWINQDYKKNKFINQEFDTGRSNLDQNKLFLKPQKWIERHRSCFSQSIIIQKIVNLVAQLTYKENQYKIFMQKVDAFISQNILKNYNFDKILKFINKYIYQNRLFVKSNLIEVIERLYSENLNEKQQSCQSISSSYSKDINEQRNPSKISTITQNNETQNASVCQLNMRKCVSSGRKQSLNQYQNTKNSQFFNSTAHTNSPTISNFNSGFQRSNFGHIKQSPIYGSYCSSPIERFPFNQLINQRANLDKNHISPQFSLNYNTVTHKIPVTQSKLSSFNPSPKSAFISSSKSSVKNKTVQFRIQNDNLRVITQRKQTQPDQRMQTCFKKSGQYFKNNQYLVSKSSMKNDQFFSKSSIKRSPTLKSNLIQQNKKSNISIGNQVYSISNSSLHSKPNIKMFKSNCAANDSQNRKQNFYTVFKSQNQKDSNKNQENNYNIFTMKTITKLISSNQNLSNQQESEGDFPSKQNVSSYTGILASMGRSAQIIQIMDIQKQNTRNNKKLKTMFVTNPNAYSKNPFMSDDKFQKN